MLQKMDRLEGPGFGNVAGRRRLVYQADLHVADAGRRAIFEARAGGVGVEAGGAVEVDRAGDQDRAVAVIDTQSCVRRALHLDIAAEVESPFVAAAVGTAQGVSLLRILRLVLEEYEALERAGAAVLGDQMHVRSSAEIDVSAGTVQVEAEACATRSEERRVGKECGRKGRSRGPTDHKK